MQGLIPIIAMPPATGFRADTNPASAPSDGGAQAAPFAALVGAFQQQYVGALTQADSPSVPERTAPGVDPAGPVVLAGLVALLPPNLAELDPTNAEGTPPPTIALVIVEPASQTVGFTPAAALEPPTRPGTGAATPGTAPTRPLQSVIVIGTGDVARFHASSDETSPSASALSVEKDHAGHGQSRVQLVAETLPQSAREAPIALPHEQPSNPETAVSRAPSPSPAIPDATDEATKTVNRATIPTPSTDLAQTTTKVAIATTNRATPENPPTSEAQPLPPANGGVSEAAPFAPGTSSESVAATANPDRQDDLQVPGRVPDQPAIESGSEVPPATQSSAREAGDSIQGPRQIDDPYRELGRPAGSPLEAAATQVASHHSSRVTNSAEGLPKGEVITVDETAVRETTLATETSGRPVEELQSAARVPLERETVPEAERLNDSLSKVDTATSNSRESELPDRVQFVQRVAQALRGARTNGEQVRLRLHPPELGSLSVEVVLRNGTLTARLEAMTEAARALLLDHLPTLRENLAQQGVQIDRFDVDVAGQNQGGRTGDGFGGAFRQSSGESPPSSHSSSSTESRSRQEETFETPRSPTAASGLDVMA